MTTRFAPSPTGLLHTGHAFAACVAHDLARKAGGRFLLRFEDIDTPRVKPVYYAAIERDLQWLGLDWEGDALRQSSRLSSYAAALASLRHRELIYPCFCTRREIQEEVAGMASAPHGPEGPLYPGRCRRLDPREREARLKAGEMPAWRLDASKAASACGSLRFSDLRLGDTAVQPTLLGDAILARKDVGTSYHLAVVVDDAHQGITHVTRGEDLLASTHLHRVLQTLLGLPEPLYLHHPLITDAHGKRLAKRDRDRTLQSLRQSGADPAAILKSFPPPI